MAEQKLSSAVSEPLRNAASAVRRVPGVGVVSKAAEGTLDKIGAVSPRSRRLAVYAGAGVLGVAGVVEWPVALTGAAVAWLTQPRPGPSAEASHLQADEEATEGTGHGTYVAMGDAVAAGQQVSSAPGPVRQDEMSGGMGTRPGGPTPPPVEPAAPDTGLEAAPAEQLAEHTGPVAQPEATPPTHEVTPPADEDVLPADEGASPADSTAPLTG
ncbi:hypothetical protein [Streptomyces sp. NPDC002520]